MGLQQGIHLSEVVPAYSDASAFHYGFDDIEVVIQHLLCLETERFVSGLDEPGSIPQLGIGGSLDESLPCGLLDYTDQVGNPSGKKKTHRLSGEGRYGTPIQFCESQDLMRYLVEAEKLVRVLVDKDSREDGSAYLSIASQLVMAGGREQDFLVCEIDICPSWKAAVGSGGVIEAQSMTIVYGHVGNADARDAIFQDF